MKAEDQMENDRVAGQDIDVSGQESLPLSDQRLGNRPQDQLNLDDIGKKDNSNVDPVDSDDDEEEKRTDDR